MSKRDYYEILGISRDASQDELRQAHRRLVRKLHPDVNKAEDASSRFSEVQEAYDVLSDSEKRSQYDRFGHSNAGAGHPGSQGGGAPWSDVDPETFESVFGDFFKGGGGGRAGGGFDSGGFSGQGGRARQAPPRRGSDLRHELDITFLVAARGGTETLRITGQDGSDEKIEVRIPAGVQDGATLRVRGKGGSGSAGGPDGDIRLKLKVGPHPWYRRDGLDLMMDVPISITESALGTSVELPLLSGSVTLRIPPGTGSGVKLKMSGRGITDTKGVSGDFLAVVSVAGPKSLSEEDQASLTEIGERLGDPRRVLPWSDSFES
jgi:DnaJ-class molecular chaperone